MAKFRYVNTGIWNDPWFVDLDPIEQHLFIYLLTNDQTNIAGIYQIPMRRMAFETGIDSEKIKKILPRFAEAGKVFHELDWVIMRNWIKNQSLNPKTARAIASHFNSLPQWLKKQLDDRDSKLFIDFDSLLVAYGYAIDRLDPNYNSNINFNLNSNPNSNASPATRGGKGDGQISMLDDTIPS